MLLHLPQLHSHLPLPPKSLTDQSHSFPPSPFFFFFSSPLPKTPKPSKSLIRSSKSDPQTLPQSAIQRIAQKLRSLGFSDDRNPNLARTKSKPEPEDGPANSAGEIFIPLPKKLPASRVGHTIDRSWSSPENPVPRPGTGNAIRRFHELKKGVWKEKRRLQMEFPKGREKVPSLAELSLPEEELRRLRGIGIKLDKKMKIGKAGITEGIVNGIHERWRKSELVKIACEDLCRMNMRRTHDLLERKTGGLVIWRSGSKIILYRGANYKYPYFLSDKTSTNDTSDNALPDPFIDPGGDDKMDSFSSSMAGAKPAGPSSTDKMSQSTLIQGVGSPNRVRFQLPGEAQIAEEADRLLDGLGPRYADWWGCDPLPVDADLLPAVVPGYRRPFRLLPYGVKPILTNDEMTTLRRLGRPLPCHFVLGRNRRHQGLAASIVKLWERCEIAKIAVKRGAQNTNSEMMAEELKWLTGGTLLSRDREFFTLYRGKDFLPPAASSAIEERRKHGLLWEKQTDSSASVSTAKEPKDGDCDEVQRTDDQKRELFEQRRLRSKEAALKRTSIKLSMTLEKKAKAEKLLTELEEAEIPQQLEVDKEGITEEERYMLRKVGLRMKPFLLLGRRGVFDGTVENMHLHWKYRELVKIITGGRSIDDAHQVALTLEAESGGILVAVERVSKGYAIIVYRGKNYERPASLRPQTLLNKREAMKRSLEAQRRESLKLHVLKLTRNIDELKLQLDKDKEMKNIQPSDESRFQLVEKEMKDMQSAKYVGSDPELGSDHHSRSVIPACHEESSEAREKHGADSTCMDSTDHVVASIKSLQATQQDKLIDFSGESEPEFSSISSEGTSYSAVNAKRHVSNDGAMESLVGSAKIEPEPLVPLPVQNKLNEMPFKAARLSNRDRLLLRKQALKMKKRPVLAVGRSNIVSGVAKTIKAHFQRYPLAIVNVKGRAKGTSVQEVVFKLEQATGAVLVSQEPSKVILYRGWGALDEPGHTSKRSGRDAGKTPVGKEGRAQAPAVSPELLAAIRLECGLKSNQEQEATLETQL